MQVRTFSHVGLTVSDFNTAVRFYSDIFGCPLVGVADTPPERVKAFFGVDHPVPSCKIGWIRVPGGGARNARVCRLHAALQIAVAELPVDGSGLLVDPGPEAAGPRARARRDLLVALQRGVEDLRCRGRRRTWCAVCNTT